MSDLELTAISITIIECQVDEHCGNAGESSTKETDPVKLLLSFTSWWTERVAATLLWDFRTLKIGVMVIWKEAPLDILGASAQIR